jgi:limonene-1,2-epoxide hydrolase
MTAAEKANVALVNAFCKSWGDKATTVEKIMESMTDDCSFKVNGQPATMGRAAVAALFTTFFKDGTRYKMETHETFAKGPVVVNARTDTTLHADKNDPPGPIVGIFIFKNGKIQEWEEVIYKA